MGTINLDYRSLFLHFECAVYLYQVPQIADVEADFQEKMCIRDSRKTPENPVFSGALFLKHCIAAIGSGSVQSMRYVSGFLWPLLTKNTS